MPIKTSLKTKNSVKQRNINFPRCRYFTLSSHSQVEMGFTNSVRMMMEIAIKPHRSYTVTFSCNVLDPHMKFVRHVTNDGEDDKTSEDTSQAVHHRHQDCVSVNKNFFSTRLEA